jgi:hypothetical protein
VRVGGHGLAEVLPHLYLCGRTQFHPPSPLKKSLNPIEGVIEGAFEEVPPLIRAATAAAYTLHPALTQNAAPKMRLAKRRCRAVR